MENEIHSKTLNTAEEINYQSGAVVSKTILKKEKGNITLFAFDEGQGLSEHTAPYDAVVEVIDGEAEITIAGNPNIVKLGEFIIMPANTAHSLKAVTKFKMLLTMIKD